MQTLRYRYEFDQERISRIEGPILEYASHGFLSSPDQHNESEEDPGIFDYD